MISSFDYYKKVESPNMYLCNPDRRPVATINAANRHLVLRFNDLSELTFTVPKIAGAEDDYARIETKRLVYVENIGWFQIVSVNETVSGTIYEKEVTAESHQTVFKNRGMVTEERVYMFYNPLDPLDEKYDAKNLATIPSVVGQLHRQLGIKVALQNTDLETKEDRGEWTLTYIDPALRFIAKGYGNMYESAQEENICRTFAKSETYGYDFMVNDVENAFEVVFEFDFLYHTIKVKFVEDITKNTNIYLSFDNVVNSMTVEEKSEDIVTVLSCNGNDLDIRTVNPMGTNYIVNFDYYKMRVDDNGVEYPWMSKELIEALDEWKVEFDKWQKDDATRTGHTKSYGTLVSDLQVLYEQQTDIAAQIQYSNLKLSDLQVARDQYLNGEDEAIEGAGIVTAETVDGGEKSIYAVSQFSQTAFDENVQVTCYTSQPTVKRVTTQSEFHYEFSFGGNGTTGTAHSMIQNFVDSDEIADIPLYFTDDSTRKSYCKLLIDSEVGVVTDSDGNISENGKVSVRGLTFTVTTYSDRFSISCPNGTMQSVLKSNSYFIYNGTRYRIIESADGIVSLYSFYVSGFERFTTYLAVTGSDGWCVIWEKHIADLDRQNDSKQASIDALNEELKYINGKCNIQDFVKAKGETLYNELYHYWIEGDYKNDNLAAKDSTTMAERIELARELLVAGQKELEKVSQPTFTLSADAVAFIKMLEFKPFTDELALGRKVTVEKDEDTIYYPALMSIEYDIDDNESFVLTFSNASKIGDAAMTFADLIKESTSTSRTVAANWADLMDYSRNKEHITDLILDPLDRTLRAAQANMANQQFIVDDTGVLGRKWNDDSRTTFEPEQVRIINNTILFTSDSWETASLALGKIYFGDGQEAYGLIADVLIGNLMFGSKMKIINQGGNISFDESGITVRDADGNVHFSVSPNGDVNILNYATSSDVQGAIDGVNDKIDGVSGDLDSLDKALNKAIDDLNGKLDQFEAGTAEDFEAFLDDLADMNSALGGLQGSFADLQASVEGLTSRVGKVEEEDGVLNEQLSKLSQRADAIELSVGTLTTNGENMATRLSDLEVSSEGILGRVTSIETNYATNQSVDDKLESYPTTTEMESAIQVVAEGLTAYAKKTEGGATSAFGYTLTDTQFSVWNGNKNNPVLLCDKDGLKINGSGTFTGTIEASGGHIGGLSITGNSIASDNGLFSVNGNGYLTATSGKIGGLTIDGTSIGTDDASLSISQDGWITTKSLMVTENFQISSVYSPTKASGFDLSRSRSGSGTVTATISGTGLRNGFYYYHISFSTALTQDVTLGIRYKVSNALWGNGTFNTSASVSKGATSYDGSTSFLNSQPTVTFTFTATGTSTYSWTQPASGDSAAIGVKGSLLPNDSSCWVGDDTHRWGYGYFDTVYANGGNIGNSDRNLKKDIKYIGAGDKLQGLIDYLKPATYKYRDGTSGRTHIGFIAQDVKDAMDTIGISGKDCAIYCEWSSNGITKRGLRYSEIIALNTYEIQSLKKRVQELETEILGMSQPRNTTEDYS